MKHLSTALFTTVATLVAAVGCSGDTSESEPDYTERIAGYIQATPYSTIRLEVDAVSEYEPNQDVIDGVTTRLEPLLEKTVVVSTSTSLPSATQGWTFEALQELADDHYDGPTSSSETVMHIMVVDGVYAETSTSADVLGVAWANRNVVLFSETLHNACRADGELNRKGLVERACNATMIGTWLHEIGHVIGLVNHGLPMVEVHNDPDHPTHDADPESIMYWQFDVLGIFDEVKGKVLDDVDPIAPFSDECLADIAAAR